ncbi:type II secretion system F family protein [Microbacterium aoyamense]|uniref:type II secretion system F family protein n=1 Tax=Microbacterium aoyamense TaxID=344166 RepID=UPI002005703D|nr:type II secretion system F family protein [Microbacterium aoyamense]
MTDLAFAVILGAAFGVGACLLLTLAPRWRAVGLTRRLAPYLRDVTDPRGLPVAPVDGGHDLASVWRAVQSRFGRAFGASASVDRRLRQSGWVMDAAAFRGRQLAWSVAGVGAGGALLVILVLTGAATTAVWLLPPLFGVTGVVLCDVHLTRAARARIARIEQELPTVLEFLTLCLSAGEGILDSLRRVSDVGSGELTAELREVVVAVGTGESLSDALLRLSARLELAPLSRTIDQIVAALDRGAPLAQVLHAQADDAREDAKRGLIERAGRTEIYMLFPLVFLILPLSVLFAVFPGIFLLRLGLG